MREIVAPTLRPLVINDPNDASLKWTGEKPTTDQAELSDQQQPAAPTKKRRRSAVKPTGRKYQQRSHAIKDYARTLRLMEQYGLNETALVNLALGMLPERKD